MTLDIMLTEMVYSFFLIFTRLGMAFFIVPGLGSTAISPQIRIVIAAIFTLLLLPVLAPHLPPVPQSAAALVPLVVLEAFYGAYLGLVVRILFAALEVTGSMMAMQSGLAASFMFNPQLQQQAAIPTVLLATLAALLFFVTDLHALFLHGLVNSYHAFPPGLLPVAGDMAHVITRLVTDSFNLGIQLAAPFILCGLLFYLCLGLLARLMPQMQVFFIALPAQLMLGIALLAISISAMFLVWLDFVDARMGTYLFLSG